MIKTIALTVASVAFVGAVSYGAWVSQDDNLPSEHISAAKRACMSGSSEDLLTSCRSRVASKSVNNPN